MVRVLIIDQHEVVRAGVGTLMRDSGIEVVGEADSVADGVGQARLHRPDVVLVDEQLTDGPGLDACRQIRDDRAGAVVMMAEQADDHHLFDVIGAGAVGLLLRNTPAAEFVEAVESVAGGETLLDSAVTARTLDRLRDHTLGEADEYDSLLDRLSPVQLRILEHVAEGLTNREIGERVHLSDKTVKNYVSKILSLLEVSRRAEAAAYLGRQRAQEEGETLSSGSTAALSTSARKAVLREFANVLGSLDPDRTSAATEELRLAVEEMQVVEEELHLQAEQLSSAREQLRVERDRYAELFEAAPVPYLVTDALGVIEEANLACIELLRRPAADLAGKPVAVLVEESERRMFRARLTELREGGSPSELLVTMLAGDEPCPLTAQVSVRRDRSGTVERLYWLLVPAGLSAVPPS